MRLIVHLIVALVALLLDVVLVAACGAAIAVASGFSGAFRVAFWSVSLTSASNPLTIAAVALVLRSTMANRPFLGCVSLAAWPRTASGVVKQIHGALVGVSRDGAIAIVGAIMAASVLLKIVIAYRHPGFWTGDDVEIHEMTFARLFGAEWRAWDLRSPVYPLGIIFPIQFVVVHLGVIDPAWLVLAGRAVVATVSVCTLWLTFHVARRIFPDGIPVAILSVVILATNKLHVGTATTELPRPVSSFLVLSAFSLLVVPNRFLQTFAAGLLIGASAALRFSEELFLAPALLRLCVTRQWRESILLVGGFAAAAMIAFGLIDSLYWGEPFYSLRHIVDFTLTRRLSTRGFQPWFEYIRAVPAWTNVAVFGLAVWSTFAFRLWTLGAWAWLPLVLLSLLPHKEPRYLVPILPYVSMLAAAGLWRLIVAVHARAETDASAEAGRQALVLLAVGIAVLMTEPLRYVLPRSDDGIAIARFIAANGPRDGVLAEPAWNLGGRIYLPLVSPLVDVDPSEMSDRTRIVELIGTPQLKWVVFQERDLRRMDYDDAIRAAGFVEVFVTQGDSRFRVYRRP